MKKIILLTTKGCEACSIMRDSIKNALKVTKKKDIEFEEQDYKSTDRTLIHKLNIRDYPTTIFINTKHPNQYVRKEIGSRPTIVVLRWIDIDFK